MSANSNVTIQPATAYPFKPGEAIYFLPNSSPWGKPIPWIPATVVDASSNGRWRLRIQRDDKPRTQMACGTSLMYRGYCGDCLTPAIVGDGGALVCPSCGAPAICEPPPDALIARWFPQGGWQRALTIRRSFEHPEWSRTMAWNDALTTIDGAYTAALVRLALVELEACMPVNRDYSDYWRDRAIIQRMNFYAMMGDDVAFLAAYNELKRDQAAPKADPLEQLINLFMIPGDGPGGPSRRLNLTPLDIARPAGDDQPDTEDGSAFDVWLRGQLG